MFEKLPYFSLMMNLLFKNSDDKQHETEKHSTELQSQNIKVLD